MRTITNDEYDFMERVGTCRGLNLNAIGLSRHCLVEPMADGGMGSLRFQSLLNAPPDRALGEAIVQGEFNDCDGLPVSFTINVDREGMLYELDLDLPKKSGREEKRSMLT
ncbi:MAG: hypothetical protein WCJ09_27960, partial [Planctomycetota bacterium]